MYIYTGNVNFKSNTSSGFILYISTYSDYALTKAIEN